MAGGSHEPDGDDDHQCIHCGRWYARAGLLPHERNCEWSDTDARMHDLEDDYARLRAPHVDVDDQGDELEDVDDLPGEGPPAEAGREAPPTPQQEAPQQANARTDGGPSPVPDDWNDADQGADQGDEDVLEEDIDGTCPNCGRSQSFDVELLPDEALEEVPELLDFDRVCHPCSTDEKGRMVGSVEVFTVDE